MTDMHPHWHSTEDDVDIPPVQNDDRAVIGKHIRIGMVAGNRLPGAVIGIVLVLVTGILIVGNAGELWDMVLSAVPSSRPAASIASSTGSILRPSLAAALTDLGNLPPTTEKGYSASSLSEQPHIAGSRLQGVTRLAQAQTEEALLPQSDEEVWTEDMSATDAPVEAASEETSSIATTDIPRNPYTVTGGATRQLDEYGRPKQTDSQAHAAAPLTGALSSQRPPWQPTTGPGLWLVEILSALLMAGIGKRMLHRM